MAALVLPESYPYYLDLIHSLSVGPFLIGLAKFGIAFPVSYHTYNGIRHLVSLIIWFIDWENVRLFFISEFVWGEKSLCNLAFKSGPVGEDFMSFLACLLVLQIIFICICITFAKIYKVMVLVLH